MNPLTNTGRIKKANILFFFNYFCGLFIVNFEIIVLYNICWIYNNSTPAHNSK